MNEPEETEKSKSHMAAKSPGYGSLSSTWGEDNHWTIKHWTHFNKSLQLEEAKWLQHLEIKVWITELLERLILLFAVNWGNVECLNESQDAEEFQAFTVCSTRRDKMIFICYTEVLTPVDGVKLLQRVWLDKPGVQIFSNFPHVWSRDYSKVICFVQWIVQHFQRLIVEWTDLT